MSLQHLIDIEQLDAGVLERLMQQALAFSNNTTPPPAVLADKTIAMLLFEPSTRTLNSFALAVMRLGGQVLTPYLETSSLQKGETDLDTIATFAAMGVDGIVLRHSDNALPQQAIERLRAFPAHIINAGNGQAQHPTQALADLTTIYQNFNANWHNLKIAIVGDIRRSRAANSLIQALQIMGVADIRLVAPPAMAPPADHFPELTRTADLAQGIAGADVIYALRIQRERGPTSEESIADYKANFCLNSALLQHATAATIIMHPGPLNYDIEITHQVAHSAQSRISQQVHNGVLVRMALLKLLFETGQH